MAKKAVLRLVFALLITITAGIYQRKTGPTYPLNGEYYLAGQKIEYKLLRSHGGEGGQPVEVIIPDTAVSALTVFRRYKSSDVWRGIKMLRHDDTLSALLPHQPPAGKLEYFLLIETHEEEHSLPGDRSVVTRFKGAVPAHILFPHILLMFIAMLLSTAAGIEVLTKGSLSLRYALWATITLGIGGMILGPVVQKAAFGAYWTGIPWGWDLTDNKTLLAFIAWLLALGLTYRNKSARIWIITASVILLLVYMIPHSVMGSELDYNTMRVETGRLPE